MGKDLKGKELGKGISQRADGRYIARFTSKTGKRKTLYDFKLNELKRKLREAVYEDEHGLNGNGESITLNAWYVTWTELYKKKNLFGKYLMKELRNIYEESELNDFVRNMRALYKLLPELIEREEPFCVLDYADDCLSYGDKEQCRKLYESAMSYYEE